MSSMTSSLPGEERPAPSSSLGRNAALVIIISLLATAGSLIFIQMQQRDDRQGNQFEQMFTPELREFCDDIYNGDVEATKAILAKHPDLMTTPLPRFGTPLVMAIRQNQLPIVTLLLEKGADVNGRGQWGGTPLHWAALTGSKEIVKLLIDRGADVGAKTEGFESTPLLWAAHGSAIGSKPEGADYIGVVETLLAAKAQPDTANSNGETAVFLASEPVARYLLAHGGKLARTTTRPTNGPNVADGSDAVPY